MASSHNVSAEIWDLPTPIIIGCKREFAERLLALPANQTLYLPSLPPSFHTGFVNVPANNAHNDSSKTIYFALPTQPLRPDQGYIFSRKETDADFQLPIEAPETANANKFRIVINEDLEWTLVDESITGVTINGTKLYSAENQMLLAGTGYHLTNPKSEMTLLAEKPNSVQVGWGGLQFKLYVLGKAVDYHYHTYGQPSESTPFSPYSSQPLSNLPQFSQHSTGTHMLRTTEDIDAELHRQTGGDLTKGFYIDPARFTKAVNPCQPSAARRVGGDVDMRVNDEDLAVLAGLGQLSLQCENEGLDAMESRISEGVQAEDRSC